jgi:hypothetical protein
LRVLRVDINVRSRLATRGTRNSLLITEGELTSRRLGSEGDNGVGSRLVAAAVRACAPILLAHDDGGLRGRWLARARLQNRLGYERIIVEATRTIANERRRVAGAALIQTS